MKPVTIVLSGYPGKMCRLLATAIRANQVFQLASFAFTGPEVTDQRVDNIALATPARRADYLPLIKRMQDTGIVLVADFSQPNAVEGNVEFYCQHGIPFVLGTSGGDIDVIRKTIESSQTSGVVARNMAAQVVGLQAAINFMAENFPGLLSGFDVDVVESHQSTKSDCSGTALSFVPAFNRLGVPYSVKHIKMIRDSETQLAMGIKEEFLGGHGWHTYTFRRGEDKIGYFHDFNGRDAYVDGAMRAFIFMGEQAELGVRGRMFSMIDVIKAG